MRFDRLERFEPMKFLPSDVGAPPSVTLSALQVADSLHLESRSFRIRVAADAHGTGKIADCLPRNLKEKGFLSPRPASLLRRTSHLVHAFSQPGDNRQPPILSLFPYYPLASETAVQFSGPLRTTPG